MRNHHAAVALTLVMSCRTCARYDSNLRDISPKDAYTSRSLHACCTCFRAALLLQQVRGRKLRNG